MRQKVANFNTKEKGLLWPTGTCSLTTIYILPFVIVFLSYSYFDIVMTNMYLSCCSCSPTSVYFLLKLFSFPTLILTSYAGQLGSSLFHHFKLFAPARLQNGRCLVDKHSDDKYMYLTFGENKPAFRFNFTSETKCAGQIIKHALAVEGQQTSFHRESSYLPRRQTNLCDWSRPLLLGSTHLNRQLGWAKIQYLVDMIANLIFKQMIVCAFVWSWCTTRWINQAYFAFPEWRGWKMHTQN